MKMLQLLCNFCDQRKWWYEDGRARALIAAIYDARTRSSPSSDPPRAQHRFLQEGNSTHDGSNAKGEPRSAPAAPRREATGRERVRVEVYQSAVASFKEDGGIAEDQQVPLSDMLVVEHPRLAGALFW